MEIYKVNKRVYDIICENLLKVEDIAEFDVWNYLYYELMTWRYNTSYFKLKNGTKLADTYEEFLRDQDGILYNSIQNIKNIYDTDTKIDTINSFLDNIKDALRDYLKYSTEDSKNDDFLIEAYTGKFANINISYMKQILDFFKSYKIYIRDLDTIISFDNGIENEENTYKFYEEIIFKYTLNYSDYVSFDEDVIIQTKKPIIVTHIDPDTGKEIEETIYEVIDTDIIRT